jgi:hypothetical protein
MVSVRRARFLLPIALCVGGLVAFLPTAASADGVTLTVGTTAQLVAGVEVDLPITVNCAPLPPPSSGMGAFVEVEEAVSKSTIAHGTGLIPAVSCDGTDQAVVAQVIADSSSAPFKQGKAVMTRAFFEVCENAPPFECVLAIVGPQEITIKR